MSKTITKVSTAVATSTQQTLVQGTTLKQAQLLGESPTINGTPEEEAGNNRVLLKVETNYGTAEEWITVKSVPAKPPLIQPDSLTTLQSDLSSFKTGEEVSINLSKYGQNMSATADYTVRSVSYTIAGGNFPSSLTLNPSTGQITGTASTGTYDFTVALSTNNGTVNIPISFTTRNPVPSVITGWNTTYWTWPDGDQLYLCLRAQIGNRKDMRWTPGSSSRYMRAGGGNAA